MEITAQAVRDLREKTGGGIMDCKKALTESNGDFEKAVDVLRKKGLAAAAKKASRLASEGLVHSYIHAGGKIGVLIEVNCETDFVAKTPEFHEFVKDLAMQVTAANPLYIKREEVPAELIEKEKEIYKAQALATGKPEKVVEKIAEGKLEKYFNEICLLEQHYIKNPDVTINQLVAEKIAKIGENISVRRFARYQVGEGLEKKHNDFAAEVAAAQKN